jgi:hypothetical protein
VRVPWIRVHGGLYDKSVVDRLCRAVGVKEHEAIGVLVTFWSGVSSHGSNGSVSTVSDEQVEKWAKWPAHRGQRRGAFAAWVRAEHQDAEGRVPEWDEYAGALELRRAKEAQRQAEKRQKLRNSTQSVAQQSANILQQLQPARANGTERYGTVPTTKQRTRKETVYPDWVEALAAIWSATVGKVKPKKIHDALKEYVAEYGYDRVKAALEVYVSTDEGPTGARKPEWFVENFHRYRNIAETPLVDKDGVMTERGRKLMARSA